MTMLKKIRLFLFGKEVKLSEDEIVQIGKRVVAEEGYEWELPVSIQLVRGLYNIRTASGKFGGNYTMTIDGNDGTVLQKGVIPY